MPAAKCARTLTYIYICVHTYIYIYITCRCRCHLRAAILPNERGPPSFYTLVRARGRKKCMIANFSDAGRKVSIFLTTLRGVFPKTEAREREREGADVHTHLATHACARISPRACVSVPLSRRCERRRGGQGDRYTCKSKWLP